MSIKYEDNILWAASQHIFKSKMKLLLLSTFFYHMRMVVTSVYFPYMSAVRVHCEWLLWCALVIFSSSHPTFSPHASLCGWRSSGVGGPCHGVLTKSALSRHSRTHLLPPLLPPQRCLPFCAFLHSSPSPIPGSVAHLKSRSFGNARPL